jgi:hypothetical protein
MAVSKTLEKNLWAWLKRGTKKVDHLQISRVENIAKAGMPDTEGCFARGKQFWMELKVADHLTRTDRLKIRWEPGQLPWLRKRKSLGGKAYALIQVGSGHKAKRYLISDFPTWLEAESFPHELLWRQALASGNLTAVEVLELIETDCGPRR